VSNRHTPGPWGVEDPFGPDLLLIVSRPSGPPHQWGHIAQVSLERENNLDPTRKEAEANARLIAAAPDMLETLKDIAARQTWNEATQARPQVRFTKAEFSNALDNCIEVARAAVAKAEGR
jgi:hypothetical protein